MSKSYGGSRMNGGYTSRPSIRVGPMFIGTYDKFCFGSREPIGESPMHRVDCRERKSRMVYMCRRILYRVECEGRESFALISTSNELELSVFANTIFTLAIRIIELSEIFQVDEHS